MLLAYIQLIEGCDEAGTGWHLVVKMKKRMSHLQPELSIAISSAIFLDVLGKSCVPEPCNELLLNGCHHCTGPKMSI